MQFVCTQANLLKGISTVSPLAGRNPQLPVLQYVLLKVEDGVLNLTCTDLEVGAHVVVGGKADSSGSCAVLAKQLLDYVQQLPVSHPVTLEKKKGGLMISTKGFSASFSVTEPDDFPLLPTISNSSSISLDGRLFGQALSGALFAAAKDDTRPEIHSLFIGINDGDLRVAATDSFRLAESRMNIEVGGGISFLLPVATAQEVVRLFGSVDVLEVSVEKSHINFQGDGVTLSSRLIDGVYPDYQQIIPKEFAASGVVDRGELIRALKVLGVFLSRDTKRVAVRVIPERDVLEFRVEGGDAGQGEVVVKFEGEGEEFETLFNIQYLLEGVSHMKGDDCSVYFGGVSDPVKIGPADKEDKYLYLVMPIQA